MPDEGALVPVDSPDLASAPFTYKTLTAIARTEFVPEALRGNVPAILACVMAGREWGLGPMESLARIDMIDGRPAPSGELLVARVFAAGHEIYPKNLSDRSATAVGIRHLPDGSTHREEYTFTWQMAERVKDRGGKPLTGKNNWRNYPEAMLYWRAASQLIRFMFPDVLSSFRAYTPDDLGSEEWVPPAPGITEGELGVITEVIALETQESEAELEVDIEPEPGTQVVVEDLGGEVVTPAPEDYETRLIEYVAAWVGDRHAAELEVKRVVKGRTLDAKTANEIYGKLKKRLAPAGAQGELL